MSAQEDQLPTPQVQTAPNDTEEAIVVVKGKEETLEKAPLKNYLVRCLSSPKTLPLMAISVSFRIGQGKMASDSSSDLPALLGQEW